MTKKNSKLALYVRVSTGMQKTDRQKSELIEKANREGREFEVYEDHMSGFIKGEERPEYARLMADVDSGKVSEIWFHELTRMARSSVELQKEIKRLQGQGIALHFMKQNLSVSPDKDDLGTRIFVMMLAVMAEYEIELFTQRSLSGKITKLQQGYGVTAAGRVYGYTTDDKRIVINPEEAAMVKRIFSMYTSGMSSLKICDTLRAEGTSKRGVKWTATTINKILNNDMYIGHIHSEWHEAVVDKEKKKKMKADGVKPAVIHTQDDMRPELAIIDSVLWDATRERLKVAPANKDNYTRFEPFIIKKLRCGECGGNFTVGGGATNRAYRCYGVISRVDIERTCPDGVQVLQTRLNGLVVELSKKYLTERKNNKDTQEQRAKIAKDIEDLTARIEVVEKQIKAVDEDYKKTVKRLAMLPDDGIAEELINEVVKKRESELSRLEKEKKSAVPKLRDLMRRHYLLSQADNATDINAILNSPRELKSMIDELIEVIELYRLNNIWALVKLRFIDGVEFWGKIKTARYKNDEIVSVDDVRTFETWNINNTDHSLTYDKETRTITKDGTAYDYAAFNKALKEGGTMAHFKEYDYDAALKKQN